MGERASEQLGDAIADLLMYTPPQIKVQENENISRQICFMRPPRVNVQLCLQKPSGKDCQILSNNFTIACVKIFYTDKVPSPEGEAPGTAFNQSSTSSTPDIGTLAMPVDDTCHRIAVGVQTPHSAVAALVTDLLFWRSMYLSFLVLLVATATWVTLQLYHYYMVEVFSRVAMLLVTLLFVWGNIHRLLKNEDPDLSGMEISESRAEGMARGIREWIDKGIRWLFRVGVEREWSVFGATVAALGLISWIATHFDLLTIVYMGVVLGMTVPAIYVKHEEKIIELWNAIYLQGLSACPCI